MSEYVFAYLLAHKRRILHRHVAQAAGQWDKTPPGTLRGKKIGIMGVGSIGAVLDVFQQESLPPEHILWRAPNVEVTFHTAALSVPEDIVQIFLDNYRRLLQGEALRCQVDFERGY